MKRIKFGGPRSILHSLAYPLTEAENRIMLRMTSASPELANTDATALGGQRS